MDGKSVFKLKDKAESNDYDITFFMTKFTLLFNNKAHKPTRAPTSHQRSKFSWRDET